jgi:hypothetical protein
MLQRRGVSPELHTVQRKAWEAWVAIRARTPWPVTEPTKSSAEAGATPSRSSRRDHAGTSRGTHDHAQLASTGSSKRKSKKQRDDMNTPGSTP